MTLNDLRQVMRFRPTPLNLLAVGCACVWAVAAVLAVGHLVVYQQSDPRGLELRAVADAPRKVVAMPEPGPLDLNATVAAEPIAYPISAHLPDDEALLTVDEVATFDAMEHVEILEVIEYAEDTSFEHRSLAEEADHVEAVAADAEPMHDGPTFDGRPLRKVRTIRMLVTAYSPDARSCGIWADGITASGYSVWTNGMKLVAADTRILPFHSIVTVEGYNEGRPVEVLDRGGAIKGNRLDLLMPTHEVALQWGVQRIDVDVWEYAD